MKRDPRNCLVCGAEHQPHRDDEVTCSTRCSKLYQYRIRQRRLAATKGMAPSDEELDQRAEQIWPKFARQRPIAEQSKSPLAAFLDIAGVAR